MKTIFAAIAVVTAATATAQKLVVNDGSGLTPISVEAESSTGLSGIVVSADTSGATAVFTSPQASANVTAYTFSNAGAAYAIPVPLTRNGDQWTMNLPKGDTGITFSIDGSRSYHYWITDYSMHRLQLDDLVPDPSQSDCMSLALSLQGNASPISYYTINGAPRTLSRELSLSYNTLAYDENSGSYIPDHKEEILQSMSAMTHVPQPLCTTSFTVSGDRFLKQWGRQISISSPTVDATAVEATASATNLSEIPDNVSSSAGDGSALGGNAPAEIEFRAEVSDAVVFTEWQLSTYPDFGIIDYRFNQPVITHTFTEYGTTYARFVAANDKGDCEYVSQTFEISIGASKLVCPNAFSPADQNGVNDEWKVSYASLIEFECNIFNRWGVHIIKLTDPSQGWDGRFGSKFVPSGVYYYVIKAKGADGKDYKLAGDINVINSRIKPGTSTSSGEQ